MGMIEEYILETPEKMKYIVEKAEELFSEVVKKEVNKIIITGSGTSFHSGIQMADQMQKIMNIEVHAMYPFMINDETFINDSSKTLVIGISQGGSSYSTYNAMKLAKANGCLTASMAGCKSAYIDEQADFILTVYCGEELAGAKTKGYYCTKLNLLLFSLHYSLNNKLISERQFEEKIEQIRDSISRFSGVHKAAAEWIDKNSEALKDSKEIRVTGPASLYGDVLESALKQLETLRCPVTGYEFEEFIHGIYNAINENSTVFILDNGQESRSKKMKEVLSTWSDNIYLISNKDKEADLYLPTTDYVDMETFNFIIPMQLICDKIPTLRGVDPSAPKDPQFHMKLGSKKFNK
ncbi:SIS domain-containing protein [Enterococcus dongliensis]|uniref:SIS domain-containing protein n=1 Tax=Enterococcus dongliensis TaxID=2559925 RepID=UPI00289059BC|nr:SIS domain-containing protein [Enterococcus dongliensis]MDT2704231.1 SIS domain-containing protein [Enterococcus dongliensis]